MNIKVREGNPFFLWEIIACGRGFRDGLKPGVYPFLPYRETLPYRLLTHCVNDKQEKLIHWAFPLTLHKTPPHICSVAMITGQSAGSTSPETAEVHQTPPGLHTFGRQDQAFDVLLRGFGEMISPWGQPRCQSHSGMIFEINVYIDELNLWSVYFLSALRILL